MSFQNRLRTQSNLNPSLQLMIHRLIGVSLHKPNEIIFENKSQYLVKFDRPTAYIAQILSSVVISSGKTMVKIGDF